MQVAITADALQLIGAQVIIAWPICNAYAWLRVFVPPQYIKHEWEYCANHEFYESAMHIAIVLNDFYVFDPDDHHEVSIDEFEGVILKAFGQY